MNIKRRYNSLDDKVLTTSNIKRLEEPKICMNDEQRDEIGRKNVKKKSRN